MPPVREHPPPIPLFDRKPPSLRPDLPPGKAPRAAAVKDAAENAAASAEPAQSVLDGASTVLPFALEAPHHDGVSRGYRPALFRLIIGGRSLRSTRESGANLIFGDECHRWPSGISPTPTQRRFRTPMLAITKIICDRIRPLMACGHFMEG
jgi:hypothetical protein